MTKKAPLDELTILQIVSKLPCMACPIPNREDLGWILDNLRDAPRISDPHHVTSRGAGGEDTAENLMPLCRKHHNEWEEPGKGPSWMIERYVGVREWLGLAERGDWLERLQSKK